MQRLDGKVIVVCAAGTGATRGASIGSVTARRLASEGANVVVGDIKVDAARRTVDRILEAGGTAIEQEYDAGSEESTKAIMDRAVAEYGALHGVHFNATDTDATTRDGDFDVTDVPIDLWHRVMDVGLLGFVFAARHSIPHLLNAGGGAIAGTSSGAAYVGQETRVSYACAKAGMGAVVRHIASRFGGRGIRANTVSPGFVPSQKMLADAKVMSTTIPNRSTRMGKPEDIAAMVAFLMSEDGEWVQGQSLVVDGGTVMRP